MIMYVNMGYIALFDWNKIYLSFKMEIKCKIQTNKYLNLHLKKEYFYA